MKQKFREKMKSNCSRSMNPSDIFDELQNCQNDVVILRRLISISPLHNFCNVTENIKKWQPILTYIIKIISNNSEFGNERVLLACHVFYVLLSTQCKSHFARFIFKQFQKLDSCVLCFLEKQYTVLDPELFKLLNIFGYLQAYRKDMYSEDTFSTMFDVIYRNCLKYTKYSYFAYKVLHMWLKKTSDTRFWREIYSFRVSQYGDDILEQKLEAIIFSNWSNALNDVSKQNAQIFNIYLRIMSEKYDGFLEHIFEMCVTDVSWQSETKYTILTEVCELWDNIEAMTTENFLLGLCSSLTKNSLRYGGTKLYLVILRKLNEVEWKNTFGVIVKFLIVRWESEEYANHNALQTLFKYWLEPTIQIHRNILTFLWELCSDTQSYFFRSHLQTAAAKLHIKLSSSYNEIEEIDRCINDKEEIVRLNAFATLCYRAAVDPIGVNETDPFSRIKHFLWFNANAATNLTREGIVKYFKILYANILKTIVVADREESISEFTKWLHEYFLDCFEIGSCYQRKILALNLYKTLLSFMDGCLHTSCARHRECLRNVALIEKYLKTDNSWKFTDKRSLFVLLRLVLDSAHDIRQLATSLILKYFDKDVLSAAEKHILYNCAWEHCNSSKFYKIESGAALVKIIAYWTPLNEFCKNLVAIFPDDRRNIYSSFSEFLLNEARCQLTEIKKDILKAVARNRPFYGVLTALLTVAFRAGPESWILTHSSGFTTNALHLLKDAVDFFLSVLSTNTSNTTVYSSSFAEIGLAIDEKIKTSEIDYRDYDDVQLSPAHQVLISCIWISLKVSCDIVSEIGMLMESDAQVRYCMDIIVTVLLKCRHKGVVESAGVAIANLSRCLYDRKEYYELPKTYVTSLLEEDTGKLLHLTRRGAGLSIMFHKLIVSDNRKDRPMVHFTTQLLLRSLENFSATDVKNVKSGQDSPWAKRLHFLRTLVADKEIQMQLLPYMEKICLTCFVYMESDVWTVRNASLQLYGAVVPRLVGQCSGRKDGESDFGNGYSVNHFVTHYPILADYTWTQLRAISRLRGTSMLRSYANAAPILILLSKMWTGGCDLVDYPSRIFSCKIRDLLREFFFNPMMYIRQLAAKAYAALIPSINMFSNLDVLKKEALYSVDYNVSHGFLSSFEYLSKRLIDEGLNSLYEGAECRIRYTVADFLENYRYIIQTWGNMKKYTCEKVVHMQSCYILQVLFFEQLESIADNIFCTDKFVFDDNLSIIETIASSQKIQPGFFQFVELWARLYAVYLKQTSNIDCKIVHKILDSDCIDLSLGFLNGLPHCVSVLEFILKYLILIKGKRDQLLLNEIVTFTLKTVKQDNLRDNELEFDEIIERFNGVEMIDESAINWNMKRLKNTLILAFSKRETLINETLLYVFDLSMDDEQFARSMATEYVEIALRRFARLGSSSGLTLMRCCLFLLKDEIIEIREIVSTSLQKHVFHNYVDYAPPCRLQHEEIVYQRLLWEIIRRQPDIASADSDVNFVRCFTRAIKNTECNSTIENPFYHDNTTFYKEESKFLNMYFLYAKFRNNSSTSNNENTYEDCCFTTRTIQTRCELEEKVRFNYDNLEVVLYLGEIDYLIRKRDVVQQHC